MRILCVALGLLLGCSGVRVPQPEAPPPRAEPARRAEVAPDAGAGLADARTPTDEAATELFLDHEIERRRYVPPAPLAPWSIAPFEQGSSSYQAWGDERGWTGDGRSRFPWNAAIGAGLGAVIGHQSGHRDQGAAIGAGVGLLFDLGRWF